MNPCPYCAGEVHLEQYGAYEDRFAVECDACEVSWPISGGLGEVIERWNKRTAKPRDADMEAAGQLTLTEQE